MDTEDFLFIGGPSMEETERAALPAGQWRVYREAHFLECVASGAGQGEAGVLALMFYRRLRICISFF